MHLKDILSPANVINNAQAETKKGVLEIISKLIAKNFIDIEYKEILSCLINREKLGSTAIGHGVALPHGRLENITNPIGAFIHLEKAIDFEANDNQPVDLFFVLLVPQTTEKETQQYLEILAEVAEKFRIKEFRQQLRTAKDIKLIYKLITG